MICMSGYIYKIDFTIIILKIHLLIIYFLLCWVLVAALGLSLVAAFRDHSSLWCVGFHCDEGAFVVKHAGSVGVGHRLSCPPGTWGLPGPGIEPMSSALAGRFLSTGSPLKSHVVPD